MLASYADAMGSTADLIGPSFDAAVDLLVDLNSILVITGLGKSGLIGKKAAATLSSTGTPSVFVHPVEALHGDLGIIVEGTALLAISKSGSNEETIEFTRQYRNVAASPVISLSEPDSMLEQYADIALHIPKLPEIDEWNLAPTTSTMTSMAICDVLAITVQQRKGLTSNDFARFHPSGALGKRLLLNAGDVMVKGAALPKADADQRFSDILYEISSKGLGLVLLVDANGEFLGVLTDGDIRRLTERHEPVTQMSGRECFHASRRGDDLPSVVKGWTDAQTKAVDCLEMMNESKITSLVVLRGREPIGVVRLQDLIAAGL